MLLPIPNGPMTFTTRKIQLVLVLCAAQVVLSTDFARAQASRTESGKGDPEQRIENALRKLDGFGKGTKPLTPEQRLGLLYKLMTTAHAAYADAREAYQQAWPAKEGGEPMPMCRKTGIDYTSYECAKPIPGSPSAKEAVAECAQLPGPLVTACAKLHRIEPRMVQMTYMFLEQLRYNNPTFTSGIEYSREAMALSRLGPSELWEQTRRLIADGVTTKEISQLQDLIAAALKHDRSLWPTLETFLKTLGARGIDNAQFRDTLELLGRFQDPETRALLKEQIAELERTRGAPPAQTRNLDTAIDKNDPAGFMNAALELNDFARKRLLSWTKDANPRQRYLQQQSAASSILVVYRRLLDSPPAAAHVMREFVNHLVGLLASTTTEGVQPALPLDEHAWKKATSDPMSLCDRCNAVLAITGDVQKDGQLRLDGQVTFRDVSGERSNQAAQRPEPFYVKVPLAGSEEGDDCLSLERAHDAATAAGRFMQHLREQIAVVIGEVDFVRQLRTSIAVVEPIHCGVTVDAQLLSPIDNVRRQLDHGEKVQVTNDKDDPCGDEWFKGARLGLELRDLYSSNGEAGAELALRATDQNTCVGEIFLGGQSAGREAVYLVNAQTRDAKLHAQGGVGMAHYVAALYPQRYALQDDGSREPVPEGRAAAGNAAWALISPGLPWVLDDVNGGETLGIVASSVDLAVWVGGALAYNHSIQLRSDYAQDPSDSSLLAGSETFRNLGNASLITLGALRLAALAGYLIWTPGTADDAVGKRTPQRPFTWQF